MARAHFANAEEGGWLQGQSIGSQEAHSMLSYPGNPPRGLQAVPSCDVPRNSKFPRKDYAENSSPFPLQSTNGFTASMVLLPCTVHYLYAGEQGIEIRKRSMCGASLRML